MMEQQSPVGRHAGGAGCDGVVEAIDSEKWLQTDDALQPQLCVTFVADLDAPGEPLMADGGLLAGSLGQVIGVGPGRGMGLMFVVMGSLAVMTALSAFAYPRIRNVEVELPDAVES